MGLDSTGEYHLLPYLHNTDYSTELQTMDSAVLCNSATCTLGDIHTVLCPACGTVEWDLCAEASTFVGQYLPHDTVQSMCDTVSTQ